MAEARDDSTSSSSSVAAAGDSAPGHYQLSLLSVSGNSCADCEWLYNEHFSYFSLSCFAFCFKLLTRSLKSYKTHISDF